MAEICFVGIRPPTEYRQRLIDFSALRALDNFRPVTEPHITVLRPLPIEDKGRWLQALAEVCQQTKRFSITLGPPGAFDHNVLFLSVTAAPLLVLHQEIVRASGMVATESNPLPPDDYPYSPHLTLAKKPGFLANRILYQYLVKKAEQLLSPYPTFEVGEITIYQRNPEGRRGHYPSHTIALMPPAS